MEPPTRLETHLAFLDALVTGVLTEDADGIVIQANPAVVGQLGLDPDEIQLIGRSGADADQILARRFVDAAAFSSASSTLRTDRAFAADVPRETLDGRVVGRVFNPVHSNGAYAGCVWVFTDVTDQVRVSRELATVNAELEQAKAQLEGFLQTTAHELRTPLSSALTFVELVTDPTAEPISAEQRGSLEVAERNLRRVAALVDELLLLGRLRSGAQPSDDAELHLETVLEWVHDEFEVTAQQRGIRLIVRIGDGPVLHMDPTQALQVLSNLVGNALDYTPRGGTVEVRTDFTGESWRLVVADTGPGIPEEEQAHLFEPYFRAAHAAAGRAGGTGLGLPIVKAIVERYGGSIELESELGAGTTVTIDIPWSAPVAHPITAST